MADSDKQPGTASPYSTGGGGVRLEHRVGALFLARMLTGRSVTELGGRAPARVAFQQAPTSRVDDLVLTAPTADGLAEVRLDVAVRRSPRFTRGDRKTGELVAALVAADIQADQAAEGPTGGEPGGGLVAEATAVERRLAVAVSGFQAHAGEIAHLAAVARSHRSHEDFFALVRTPGKFAARARLAHLTDMVAAALGDAGDDRDGAEYRCWSLLRRLWVMQTRVEPAHEDDWTALADDLRRVTAEGSLDGAAALRDLLEQLAGEFAAAAGVVDIGVLRRRLHGRLAADAHTAPPGWGRLLAADRQARSAVDGSVTVEGSSPLTLRRTGARDALRSALASDGDLLVRGESGVGKSALVMAAIAQENLGEDWQALALNLRHLPALELDLLALLGAPPAELLSELTAPRRLLVIDGAEAATEGRSDTLAGLVRAGRASGCKVVVVTTTEGARTVADLMARHGAPPAEVVVPGLDDAELGEVAAAFPRLRRLVDEPRARELLRRAIVVDLLCRSGDPGLPLSEAQALEHVWAHLVRDGERRERGAPDSREHVMLTLAAHAVRPGDVDALLSGLDHDAVDGLRHSGLLRAPSGLPWERVPAFRHDLVRSYAVARMLLAERDPTAALVERGVPRWTLPSARLACGILLSAPDAPGHPRAGRLQALQAEFDALASAGHGERWSDVPTEAALALPNSRDVLADAWPALTGEGAAGVERVIRVVRARHQRSGLPDPLAVEPLVELLGPGLPRDVAREASALVCDWLRAHVLAGTARGHPAREALRDTLVRACAEREEAPDHDGPGRRPTYRWISESEIEQLALLGPDLGPSGEALLRRVAEHEPDSLEHAVEPLLAGHALAAHDPRLLRFLTEAYYIDRGEDDEDDHGAIGWSGGVHEEGIREHRWGGYGPLAARYRGPFLAMLRADYAAGVATVNRILDHAARYRDRIAAGFRPAGPPETTRVLGITGEEREYAGDTQAWLWYRGTGAGPYPCMSALLALEAVTEEHVAAGVAPARLTRVITAQARNLAAPALALAVLVRHLEDVGDAIDPYLAEPAVWQLEFSRSITDQTSSLAAATPDLPHQERRPWTLREVAMTLALRADPERAEQLRAVGRRLTEKARLRVGDDDSDEARQHLAAVGTWAAGLDPASYEARAEGDRVVVQQAPDPEAERILADTNADLRRANDAVGLTVRHAHVRENAGRAPSVDPETLARDIRLAAALIERPPRSPGYTPDGPVAVAATAIELHLTSRATVPLEDLHWAAAILLGVSASLNERPADAYDETLLGQGADRSAARALPYLLLPSALELRRALEVRAPEDVDELIALSRGAAVAGDNETRLAYARALDAVWAAPCESDHLHGRCHHEIAHDLVIESLAKSVIGPWDHELQHRRTVTLDPPVARSLDTVDGRHVYVRRLSPALRALGAASASGACRADDATVALRPVLAAHQRGMLARKHGHLHGQSDSLVAARAALRQASAGRDDTVLDYVSAYAGSARVLAEALGAIAAAAEESAAAGTAARRLWPRVVDLVLDAARAEPRLFVERTWGDHARAALIPVPVGGRGYLTSELVGEPHSWWDLLAWAPQVERWLEAGPTRRSALDHLVIAVSQLNVPDQVGRGLMWVERAVEVCAADRSSTFTLPEWLHARRADLHEDDDLARWHRVVDMLVVAGDTRVADLAD